MPIFYNKKTIFIRVPKTASKSMHVSMNESEEVGEFENTGPIHEKISTIKDRVKKEVYEDFFKFAFVRNPWDWLLSWISYKQGLKKYETEHFPLHFDFNKWIEEIDVITKSRGGNYWLPGIEFTAYIAGKKPIGCSFGRCRSGLRASCICLVRDYQHHFICDKDKNLMVDFVGRFENIEEDWAFVTSKVGIENNLTYTNKSNHKHYREVYTDKTAEIVYNLFKEDIDMFGYKF